MPLLHKKPFKKNSEPNLQPENKVFYCELTNEAFTDYDEFWERLVLCNAMVWTCEMTGRTNLTFEEAVESEKKARKCLSKISPALHKPLLYLTSLTKRSKYADMNDDIFNFVRDRYFQNEPVEAIVNKHWYDCKVIDIVSPTLEEVAKYELDMEDSDDEEEPKEETKPQQNGDANDSDSDIIILDGPDDKPKPAAPPKVKKDKNDPQVIAEKMKQIDVNSDEYPPYAAVKYVVEEIDPWDYKECRKHTVTWEQIRRNKTALTKEKLKLYLKQCVELDNQGYWTLKGPVKKKYKIEEIKFKDIFIGNMPKFEQSKAKFNKVITIDEKKKAQNKIKEMKEIKKREKKEDKESPEEKKKREEAKKIQMDNEKQSKLEERERQRLERKKEKDVKKEEKRLLDIMLKDWSRVREDLDCDDHKNLPMPTPIQCRIPNPLFGDFMMLLEFLSAFAETIEVKDVYPHGISFDMLEHALIEKEVAGLFSDVLQLLLGAIFSLQEQEDDEIGDAGADKQTTDERECKDPVKLGAVKSANIAARWTQRFHGSPIQKVTLDALTLTEVLRLHLLASGATNVANSVWRHNNRGGFKVWDDPGMQLKFDQPELIEILNNKSVFDFTIDEKMKILQVLMNQILTYASVRDVIDESLDKAREIRNELRLHKYAESRQEREDSAALRLKQKEKQQRKIDRILKKMEKKAEGATTEELEAEDEEEMRIADELEEKRKEKKRQELFKKEQELLTQLKEVSLNVNLMPLGQDRAYRRYWMFENLDGLFVEDCEQNPGDCREKPTRKLVGACPQDSDAIMGKIKAYAIKNIEEAMAKEKEEKSTSDKENDGSPLPAKQVKNNQTILKSTNLNGVETKEPIKTTDDNMDELKVNNFLNSITEDICLEKLGEENPDDIYGLCSGDLSTCYVHNEDNIKSRPIWLFYNDVSHLESLIESLNVRGSREAALKESLIMNKTTLENSLSRCPVYKLDPTKDPDPESDKSVRKSSRGQQSKKDGDTNLNFPLGTPIDEIFDSTIRDMIIEMEEKINMGFLGSLKVPDADVWRNSIAEGHSVGNVKDLEWGGRKRINELRKEHGLDPIDDVTEFRITDPITGKKFERSKSVENYAIGILQVAHSVDPKYLKPPLGETEKQLTKRRRAANKMTRSTKDKDKEEGSESESDSDDEERKETSKQKDISLDQLRTPMERWEMSLMACTNLSQLFLHLSTLDTSITWSRSALNTRCRICRKKSDPDNMLLCDGCDKGTHIYCLKPKLKSIPSGDWFCNSCKPKEKPKSPTKKRKIYKEESEDEDSDEEEEESEDDGECELCNKTNTELQCCTCSRLYHLECADVRKAPRGSWTCSICRLSSAKTKGSSKSSPQNKKKANAKSTTPAAQGRKRKPPPPEDERPSKRSRHEPEEAPGNSRRSLVDENSYLNAAAQEVLLQELFGHDLGWPFLKPVSKKQAPDYYNVVKKPMDFRTVHNKMNNMKYQTDAEFIADILLVFQNCQQYNLENTDEYKCGVNLCKYFRKRVKELGLHADNLLMNGTK